jgi:hypothetical protein
LIYEPIHLLQISADTQIEALIGLAPPAVFLLQCRVTSAELICSRAGLPGIARVGDHLPGNRRFMAGTIKRLIRDWPLFEIELLEISSNRPTPTSQGHRLSFGKKWNF